MTSSERFNSDSNWARICAEYEQDIGRKYATTDGKVFVFFGIVNGYDDYYYGMSSDGQMVLSSCVGSLENSSFTRIEGSKSYSEIEAEKYEAVQAK